MRRFRFVIKQPQPSEEPEPETVIEFFLARGNETEVALCARDGDYVWHILTISPAGLSRSFGLSPSLGLPTDTRTGQVALSEP